MAEQKTGSEGRQHARAPIELMDPCSDEAIVHHPQVVDVGPLGAIAREIRLERFRVARLEGQRRRAALVRREVRCHRGWQVHRPVATPEDNEQNGRRYRAHQPCRPRDALHLRPRGSLLLRRTERSAHALRKIGWWLSGFDLIRNHRLHPAQRFELAATARTAGQVRLHLGTQRLGESAVEQILQLFAVVARHAGTGHGRPSVRLNPMVVA